MCLCENRHTDSKHCMLKTLSRGGGGTWDKLREEQSGKRLAPEYIPLHTSATTESHIDVKIDVWTAGRIGLRTCVQTEITDTQSSAEAAGYLCDES